MKILAVDTSSQNCSVAILENNHLIMIKNNQEEKTHSQKLMPIIQSILEESNLSLNQMDLLAACQGPGSFTGIRIGIATIKAFADVHSLSCCGISSLESLSYNIETEGLICSIIDAKNNNVYFSMYEHQNGVYTSLIDMTADTITSLSTYLSEYRNKEITFIGDGSSIHHSYLSQNFTHSIFATEDQNIQSSFSLGKCAYSKYKQGKYGDSNHLLPIYLKKSQAERALEGEK